MTPEQLFLDQLPHIEKVAAQACRRKGFRGEETEDFVSIARLKILEDDYGVIRKHKEKSTLKTYLTVVVQRCFQDYLNHIWGKWRPSAEAEKLGPIAIQLDRLLHRDRLPLDEAIEVLVTNYHVEATRQELWSLASKLPRRTPPRREESEDALESRPARDLQPDEQMEAQEAADRRQVVFKFLKDALKSLPADDALLAKMSCEHKISVIARRLGLEQKPLYRRLDKILKTIREDLEKRGVRSEEVSGLLSTPDNENDLAGSEVVNPDSRPSYQVAEPRRPEKGADLGVN